MAMNDFIELAKRLGFHEHEKKKNVLIMADGKNLQVIDFGGKVAPGSIEEIRGNLSMMIDGDKVYEAASFGPELVKYYQQADAVIEKAGLMSKGPAPTASPAKEAQQAPAASAQEASKGTTAVAIAKAQSPAVKKDFAACAVGDIPQQFVMKLGDKPYVMKAGLLFMAKKMGVKGIVVKHLHWSFAKDDMAGVAICEATVTLSDGSVYTDIGVAHKENTNQMIVKGGNLDHMASTRASNRALRLATACGMCSIEEIADAPEDVINAEGYTVDE